MRSGETPPDESDTNERTTTVASDATTTANRRASNRRGFLKLTGASALALGGLGFGSTAAAAQDGGPPNPDNWSKKFEDKFEGGSLDKSSWSVGWGWGNTSDSSRAKIVPKNTTVQNNRLTMEGTHNGDNVLAGGVNTKGKVKFGPGSYVEARLRFPERVGFHPAFWAKPVSGAWPPEFDIVEVTQDGSGRDDTHKSRHFLHYSVSTKPGDKSTHEKLSKFYEPGDDLTKNFHVYGAKWSSDGITYYVDGKEIVTWSDPTMLEAFRKGAPFYIMLNMNVNVDSSLNNYLGTADLSKPWGEAFEADWVRVWTK